MEREDHSRFGRWDWLIARILLRIIVLTVVAASASHSADVPLNMVVSSSGQIRSDGKGPYTTGVDFVGVWLEPSKWSQMSFDFCMNWPFSKPVKPTRTVEHHLTAPVPGGGGTSVGVFTSPFGNDLVISKPMTATTKTFMDISVGASVSPHSSEVRFCNANCSEYYVLIFGEGSVWYPEEKLNGAGTTKSVVTRTSQTSWSILFPPKSIGRLWRRSGMPTDLGLYYYEGRVDVGIQKPAMSEKLDEHPSR